ncbi:MAG: PAS domain S-box protein [Nitrospira sp.]|nr:PAS domain S-box protein [Nitrospira sp.]
MNDERSADTQFCHMVESAPCGMVVVDVRGVITFVNRQMEDLFGYHRTELVGQSIEQLVPERYRAAHSGLRDQYMQAPLQRAMGVGKELYGLRKDGTEVPVEIGLSPFQSHGVRQVVATVVDITARKSAEDRFKLVVESAPCGMLMADAHGTIQMVNHQVEVQFGYEREELLGQPIEMLLPRQYRKGHSGNREAYMREATARGMGEGRDLFGLRKDGSEFPVEIGLNPIDLAGQGYVLAIVLDISERKLAEKRLAKQTLELSRSNNELEQFAYAASHDLQEPLRMVSSYCGLLARRYKDKLDQDANEFIGFAIDGATRMKHLIDALLLYSRVGRSQRPFSLLNATDCLQAAIKNLEHAIKDAQAEVTYDALPVVSGEAAQLMQVFQNLIGNAIKFRSDRKPVVHVTARRASTEEGVEWEFAVTDNGIGIEPEHRDRVFVIFQRLHTREEYPGHGMGLAITKKIIEYHGGRIWVESVKDLGATFRFTLRGEASSSERVPSMRDAAA